MDAISRIEIKYDTLSKGHKALANYVLAHFDKAAFMNVGQLSEVVGVSEATVVRFSSELGYEKYQLFQKAILEYAKSKLTSLQRMNITYDRLGDTDVLSTVLHSDIDKIRTTLANISQDEFEMAVEKISNAQRVYIVGLRSAAALAQFLGFYLNLMLEDVHVVRTESASEIFEQLYRMREDDVVIGISFPRYSKRTINALKYAKKMGATVVGLTDSVDSPIAQYADFSLLARSDMASFVDSLVAPLSVINALIVALGAKRKDEVYKIFEDLENIWHEYEVYDNAENEQS